jgi:hypothetical protein
VNIWDIANIDAVSSFAKAIGCDWIEQIQVLPDASCDIDMCHNNVSNYITSHGGSKVLGYYLLESIWGYQAILHSVWKPETGQMVDITPFSDKRRFNVFAKLKDSIKIIENRTIYSQSLAKYKSQENENMYYVYALIDPRDELPFYIGKGKGRRASTHLWAIPETRNEYKENKIAAIRAFGLEPRIEYLAEDIIDEQLAYKMEEDLITKYGRKGYEEYGILTNVCSSARPPNHKGKSYEQIYGHDRALIEKKKRADLQKARGGYGPSRHSVDSKLLIKESSVGVANANNSGITEDDILAYGADFCKLFEYNISAKKWVWYCASKGMPTLRKTYRFNSTDILDIFCKKFNATKKYDSMFWFVNESTGEHLRRLDWEVELNPVPPGFIRGRRYYRKTE